MKDHFYWVQVFDVTDAKATLLESQTMDAEVLVEKNEDDDNIWNEDITLKIFATKDGVGFEHEIPGGYSEYTYDPDTTRNFYLTLDADWFFNFGLDQDKRNMLSKKDMALIKSELEKLKG